MKIQQVKIKEFKALSNIEQEVNGNNLILLGDNGVGKSTFIQFIEIALGKQTNIPPNASGEGEVITNKDGNKYTFTVKFKDGKPVVTVTSPDGMKDSRKGVLASIVGAMDFDIDKFVELSKSTAGRKQQVEIFKSFLPAEVKTELERFEANVKADYDSRADLNKLIKEKDGFVKTHRLYPVLGVKTYKHTEMKDVIAKLKEMNENNKNVSDVKNRFNERKTKISTLEADIKKLTETLTTETEVQEKAKLWLDLNVEHTKSEIEAVEKELESVEKDNKDFTDYANLKKEAEHLKVMTDESGDLTAKIESGKQAIADTIRDMDAPIQGLSYDNETLVYNGTPVNPDSLSTGEIMELGIKLKMAENPDLGILFIERGESLGEKRLKEIQELAKKNDWQIIMEQVERGKETLHIEIMA